MQAKKTVASTAVVRDRKLAEPVAPNRLPEAPGAEGRADIRAPAVLEQHQTDHAQRGQHLQDHQQSFENCHLFDSLA